MFFLQKLMNISDSFRARFVRHYEDYILRKFRSFAFKSQWTESVWTKIFSMILMFHVSFCRYFEYLHFSYWTFFHIINISFYKRKTCFLQLFDFFSHIFFTSFESQHTHFFSKILVKRNASLQFFSGKILLLLNYSCYSSTCTENCMWY